MKKYILTGLGCLFLLGGLLRLSLPAKAEDNVLLHSNGNQASVVLAADEIQEEVVSLQISFQVETKAGDSQKNQISFEFDKSITSAVQQYRYHQDTGMLNVYVAGKENLCKDGELSLGSIVLSSDDEQGASASVQVVDQSLVTVNKAFDKQTSFLGSGSLESRADLVVGNGGKAPETPPVDDGNPEEPPTNKDEESNPPVNKGEEDPPANKGEEENPTPDEGGNIQPPSTGDNSGGSTGGSSPSKKRGSSGSSSSNPSATQGSDTSLGNLLQGVLNRRPKTVQGTLNVATAEDTEKVEDSQAFETDSLEPLPEEVPREETDTSKEEEGLFADKEEVVEKAVDVGLVAGIVAAIVVLILMFLELKRQQMRRRHRHNPSETKKK